MFRLVGSAIALLLIVVGFIGFRIRYSIISKMTPEEERYEDEYELDRERRKQADKELDDYLASTEVYDE